MDCTRCGTEFDVDEVRSRFNHYYAGSADWDYDRDVAAHICLDCAEEDVENRWMDGKLNAADGDPPTEAQEVWRNLR